MSQSPLFSPIPMYSDLLQLNAAGRVKIFAVGTVDVHTQRLLASYSGLDTHFLRDPQNKEFVVFDAGGSIADYSISAALNDLTLTEEQCEECALSRFTTVYNYYEDKAAMIGDIVMMVIFDGLCESLMHRIRRYVGVDFKYVYVRDFSERPGVHLTDYRKACLTLFSTSLDARMIMYIPDIATVEYFNEINALF